ncbi:extracellular solute-binding protein [Microvirga subterranea]|uniref:Microcin C transport system substrate-binding protein n=1 Tax=Microvirga subterranea TaxID=186651 RepID=A0A370HR64_9HYPH|nr:extracellular solute-binding protein [Microvirga subterranea]RDI59404.1 microcin C transport system substrate-binding protein [Microvirga subterranea]
MRKPTRRILLQGGAAVAALPLFPRFAPAQEGGETETYGLSSFGDLKYGPDFKHFDYVNPNAPKGGTLAVQIKQATGNQNFDTFNTLNIFVLRGDGAAGMGSTFDSLMAGSGDEPDALYGLVAKSVRVSDDKLTYRFLLRPEAHFHDGSKLTARDVAFSLNVLKEKGHPVFRSILTQMTAAEAEADDILRVRLAPDRSRDLHLTVAGMPIFSERYWQGRDFEASTLEAPLGSGPYKVARFEQGRFIEFERVPDYWAKDLPVNVGQNNFDRIRFEYFRDRTVAFEAFKNGTLNYHEEYTSRLWATGYDFPAFREGRVKKEQIANEAPVSIQGWYFNTRRAAFKDPRIREAIGLAFDFEWTNANIMFGSYKRTTSYFENTDMKATGKPSPEELALLEPFRDKLPATVFGEPPVPPVSDGSGQDRQLLRRADELLRAAGCKREGGALKLPNGQPFTIEFLDFQQALQPHTQPFQSNLKRLGIDARSRIVDAAQYQRRMDEFDFDMASRNLGGSATPGDSLRIIYGSKAAETPGSRNLAGIADPAVDALIERISQAKTRADLVIACRALDRVLRAGHYWVPMWFKAADWLAFWDQFSHPDTKPRFSSGAPGTWWYDAEKAKRIGRG